MAKPRHYIGSLLACLALMVSFVSCKEEEMPVAPPEEDLIIPVSRVNSFVNLDVPSDIHGWTVEDAPEWASPTSDSGNDGAPLKLFIETNDENKERRGTVSVRLGNGSTRVYTLIQSGTDLDESAVIPTELLDETMGVGCTVDVFGANSLSKYRVITSSPLNFVKLQKAMEAIGETNALVDEDRFYSRYESVTGSSATDIANQLSINAKLEVGVSAFKLSVEGGYSQNHTSSDKYAYALEEIQHIVASRQLRPGVLRRLSEMSDNIFQGTFKRMRDSLKEDYNNTVFMKKILDKYGTHIITQGSLGGELKLSMQMKVTEETSESDIHAALDLGVKIVEAKGSFNMTDKEKKISNNTSISLVTYGGQNVYTISPGATFETFQNTVKDKKKLEDWVSTIKSKENLALIDIELIPIYELLPTDEAREAMRVYMLSEYQKERYATASEKFTGPGLYKLTGINNHADDQETPWICNEYITDLNTQIVAKRVKLKELDPGNYVTVVYSGPMGNVDYTRGFFIGSADKKPCKISYDRNGKFTKTELPLLAPGAVGTLYVDPSGDITLAPNGAINLYQDISFDHWAYNIEEYNDAEEFRIDHDMIISGVNKKLLLKMQKSQETWLSVTLDNAELGGIVSERENARIIARKNSHNRIVSISEREPAIRSRSNASGNILISGSGHLFCESSLAPAIGKCTSITIEEVNLHCYSHQATAIGGWWNPQDDSEGQYKYTIRNILINSGSVVAKSNTQYAPAIGIGTRYLWWLGGNYGLYMNKLFISKDVESVKVHAVSKPFIGAGTFLDKINELTIEDPSKIIEF